MRKWDRPQVKCCKCDRLLSRSGRLLTDSWSRPDIHLHIPGSRNTNKEYQKGENNDHNSDNGNIISRSY